MEDHLEKSTLVFEAKNNSPYNCFEDIWHQLAKWKQCRTGYPIISLIIHSLPILLLFTCSCYKNYLYIDWGFTVDDKWFLYNWKYGYFLSWQICFLCQLSQPQMLFKRSYHKFIKLSQKSSCVWIWNWCIKVSSIFTMWIEKNLFYCKAEVTDKILRRRFGTD